jgi:hypothetical protein
MNNDQANILVAALGKAKAALRGYLAQEDNATRPDVALKAVFAALETEPVNQILKELGHISLCNPMKP